jgi:hypothetical protein
MRSTPRSSAWVFGLSCSLLQLPSSWSGISLSTASASNCFFQIIVLDVVWVLWDKWG